MFWGKIFGLVSLILVTIFIITFFLQEEEPIAISKALPELIEVETENFPPEPISQVTSNEIVQEENKVVRELPEGNLIPELFNTKGSKLPFIETVTYKSRVDWQKGRPAWLSDYASYYDTSRHFIARSLNGKPNYLKQDVSEGDRFNVFKKDFPISFHLVIDTSRCRLWLYCIDALTKEKFLLKTYPVSLGRPDSAKTSGLLTPLGKYSLGNRVAIYKPSVLGNHKGQKVEMISVFGTRWIPFEKELANCTAPAKGFGLHGVPWVKSIDGNWKQNDSSLGKYESDGCIRMASSDIEEVFAIIITKPSVVEIVNDFTYSEINR